jgi:DGQHR domain-containing protein
LRADELSRIAEISRATRDDRGDLIGYQRPEVRRHVANILEYLDSDDGCVLFPNSIILAMSSSVRFTSTRGPRVDGHGLAVAGTLQFTVPREGQTKPAWIVDGQQRAMALSRCKRRDFPVPVSAFIADDIDTQREQFLRVNSTKPLPRGLISELLPKVTTVLPANLAARRAPAALCDMLSRDPESPFHGLIRRSSGASKRTAEEVVTDTALMQVIQESLSHPSGCLFAYRNLATGETDFGSVRHLLFVYWTAVRDTFPDAWGKPSTQSRLMHSAGLRAMGKLMDRIMATVDVGRADALLRVRRELASLAPICRWTSGRWEALNGLRWNELQNIPAHVRMLSNLLLRIHMIHVTGAA